MTDWRISRTAKQEALKEMDNNWTIDQTRTLFNLVREAREQNCGLVKAFTEVSEKTGRSVNSVRNYYYSQLKMFELVPSLASDLGITLVDSVRERFELFSGEEIDELIRRVLVGKGSGKSVRKLIAEMAGNDSKKALRLQNKYRSMIIHHRDKVTEIMRSISESGENYYNPYTKEIVAAGSETDNYGKLQKYVASLDESEIGEFLTIMKKLFA